MFEICDSVLDYKLAVSTNYMFESGHMKIENKQQENLVLYNRNTCVLCVNTLD